MRISDWSSDVCSSDLPGAMAQADTQNVDGKGVKIGSVSAESREAMLLHAQQFADAGIPFIFDPGQGIPLFNGEEFRAFIDKRSEEHTSELQSLMRISYAVFCLKKQTHQKPTNN